MISIKIENPSDADQRIDKFIKKFLPEAPLWGIYKWLRTGKVKINRKKVEQTYRIELDDIIDIYLKEEEIAEFKDTKMKANHHDKDAIAFLKKNILFEDDSLLIINKDYWVNVHPWDHKTKEVSLIEYVQDYLWEKHNSLSFKPSLVHRIDRDTTGAIMIAKDKQTLIALLQLLQNWKIEKIYHALILWNPVRSQWTIKEKLNRQENATQEAKVVIDPLWQEAITHYRVINAKICNKYCLIEVRIETGRTHQIRVHMTSLWCPILWDKAYGNQAENSFAKRSYGISRQMLHAYMLKFIHPKTGKSLEIIAPYHDDMKHIIDLHALNEVNIK